jgi:hypothetical protein
MSEVSSSSSYRCTFVNIEMANPPLIPLPAPLRVNGNMAVEWKRFHGQRQTHVKATKIDKEDAD